jgi:spermidine synthase
LTVTKQADQKKFYENNVLLFSTNDVAANEEAVHYAMIQHPHPKYVLLISGGISGITQEILKYNIDRIDYVEINPWLIDIGMRYTSALANKKIKVVNEDARLYIRNTSEHYDVALINLPDPGTAQINRYYTVEFFQDLKRKLNKDAVISTSLLASTDYLSDEARQINSIMYNTLKTEFKNILIVPGLKTYFLASDNDLHIDIARMIEKSRINNSYVNQYYLDDQILKQRSSYIENNIEKTTTINKDFTPFSYYRQLLYWLSYFKFSPWIFTALCAVVFVILVLKLNAISLGIFTGGFAASSIEVLLLIAFQIIYGNVYQITGIIITIFMAGLAVGIFFGNRMLTKVNMNDYIKIQLSIGVYAVLLPFVFLFLHTASIHSAIIHGVFFLITSVIAILIGMEFFIASRLQRGAVSSIASKLYSIDLIGSAFGALIVSAYLIPLLGIINVCFIIALLNFTSGMISFMKRKNFLLSFA